MSRHEQQGRGVRRTEEISEEGHAVRIAPVEIVDPHDERPPHGDPREQLAQRCEGAPADLLRIDVGELGLAPGQLDARSAQHREDAQQRADAGWQIGAGALPLTRQEAAEIVDHSVDRLEANRLLGMTTRAQHEDVVLLLRLGQERFDERALADAGSADDAHGRRLARSRRALRPTEDLELGGAADERGSPRRRPARPRGRVTAQPREAFRERRTVRGRVRQEIQRQSLERLRHVRVQSARGRRRAVLPIEERAEPRTLEGQATRQALVQRHAGAIEVRRGADRLAPGLLRSGVGDRAGEAVALAGQGEQAIHPQHEAEVEEHHAAGVLDEHVPGFTSR
jgi:hypothetical protein